MAKHSKDQQPSTGNGRKRSRGPIQNAEMAVRTSNGAILGKATAKLFPLFRKQSGPKPTLFSKKKK